MTTQLESCLSQTELPYRCEFDPHEIEAMAECVEAHGFAIVKSFLPNDHVEELKDSVRQVVNPNHDLGPGQSRVFHAFIEHSPSLAKLLENESYHNISRRLLNTDSKDLTVHRSAAIIRNPGSSGMEWHSDWAPLSAAGTPPRNANEVLNTGQGPSGLWFYLTGSHPQRGGIAVMPDSHTADWSGPEGFEFTAGRQSFHRKDQAAQAHHGPDVPGALPIVSDGGDLIVFAARTYHAAMPHHGDEPRLSCAMGFRAGRSHWPTPWPLPASAKKFIASVPPAAFPLVEHYTGIVADWQPDFKGGANGVV